MKHMLRATVRANTLPSPRRLLRRSLATAIMATPHKILVRPADVGLLTDFAQNEKTAAKVTALLQEDMETHHVFFNESTRFHNHIPHHLLTLYGVGGDVDSLQLAWDGHANYQIKAKKTHREALEALREDWAANAPNYLDQSKHYSDFLEFFQSEMEKKGWKEVVVEYLFSNNQQSKDLFGRLFAGLLHPLIQFMYGIEWEQPAIIATGLAQAAVHKDSVTEILAKAEEKAKGRDVSELNSLVKVIEDIQGDDKLRGSAKFESDKLFHGVLSDAPEEIAEYMSRVRVEPGDLEERTAEMIHTAAYISAAAAFHKDYVPTFDFFIIHHLTSAPIFLTINKCTWIPLASKVRLLEWKMRHNVLDYVARGSPALDASLVASYKPRHGAEVAKPTDLLPEFYRDTGSDNTHMIKTVRSALIAQEATKGYEEKEWVRIREEDWLKVHYILRDMLSSTAARWIRGAGFDQAWEGRPKL